MRSAVARDDGNMQVPADGRRFKEIASTRAIFLLACTRTMSWHMFRDEYGHFSFCLKYGIRTRRLGDGDMEMRRISFIGNAATPLLGEDYAASAEFSYALQKVRKRQSSYILCSCMNNFIHLP